MEIIQMAALLGLLALWLLPIAVFFWARRRVPARLWCVTGISLGLVVAPASSGLYGLYFVGPLAALVGLVGLPLALFHGGAGFELATALGLREAHTVVRGMQHLYIALLNAIVWASVYGGAGWVLDAILRRWRTSGGSL